MKPLNTFPLSLYILQLLFFTPFYFAYSQHDAVLEDYRGRLERQQQLSEHEWAQYIEKLHDRIAAAYEVDDESPEIATDYTKYLLPYQEQFLAQKHPLTPLLIHNSCRAIYRNKQYEAAADLIDRFDQIQPIEQLTTLTPNERYHILSVLRNAYRQLERRSLAINTCKRNLSFLRQQPSIEERILRINFYLGRIALWEHSQNSDWETALSLCQEAERNCGKSDRPKECYLKAYLLKGNLFNKKWDYERAKEQFNKCFDIIARYPDVSDITKAEVYANAAKAYYYSNGLRTAIEYFEKAAAYGGERYQQYINIGSCYTYLGEYNKAEKYINKALKLYGYQFGKKHPYGHLKRLRYNHAIAVYMQAKNHQIAFQKGEGTHYLYKAQPYFEQAVKAIERISQEVEDSGTGRFLSRFFYDIIEQSINNRYHLYEHTDSLHHLAAAFDYAERCKALLLKEAAQRSQFNAPLPEELIGRRQQLEQRIAHFENRVYELEEQKRDPTGMSDSAVWARQKYHNFMDSLERAFPDYKRLRVKHTPLDIHAIQQQLARSNRGLVQYFAGYEHIYMFRIWDGHFDLTRVLKPKNLEKNITALRSSLYEWAIEPGEEDLEAYHRSAYELYSTIFAPLKDGLPQRLLIVADGVLQNIPFDVLLRDSVAAGTPFEDYPYLIKDYQISYAHSAYLHFAELPRRRAAKPRVLGFAPAFEEAEGPANSIVSRQRQMGPLLSNTVELEEIAERFPLDPAIGNEATRQRFLELAPQYSVLHLATHAKANNKEGESSFLCFAGTADSLRRLYTRDLYTVDLNADLVVLSACETGIGQLAKGEGTISLARGFTQAGARSLVNTLWRVSDQAAAELMTYFYDGLEEGQTKDEALRNAKLQYLATAPAAQRHPFFWGAYVGTGDMSPLQLRSNRRWWWIGGLLLVGGLFVFYRSRR